MIVISTCERSTVVSLKLLELDYRLEISLLASYPNEPPQINGIDPLWMMICSEPYQRMRLMSMHLNRIFMPGKECLFDFLSTSTQCLPKSDLASKVVISPDLAAPEL